MIGTRIGNHIEAHLQRWFFSRLERVRNGQLDVTTPDGKRYQFAGEGAGVTADMQILDWRCVFKTIFHGSGGFGDAWVRGMWDTSDLQNCLEFFAHNLASHGVHAGVSFAQLATRLRYAVQRNTSSGSRRNIMAHYDLGNDFYKTWLDSTMSYSSALFSKQTTNLQQAQENKLDRIIKQLGKSSRILEIGCGWGNFINRAVRHGHEVRGITLSQEQARWARATTQPLGKSASVHIEDYRIVEGKYDAVVSIEMYEAVGEAYWRKYFTKICSSLKKNGTALIQAITISDADFEEYRRGTDFIRNYIFPGGMLASKERLRVEAEAAGLRVVEIFSFGKSYAQTLEIWSTNFNACWHQLQDLGFDERFARIWRYYLAGCRASFLAGITDVSHIMFRRVS